MRSRHGGPPRLDDTCDGTYLKNVPSHASNTARAVRDSLRRLLVAHGAFDEARRPCGTPLPAPHAWALVELRGGPSTVTTLAGRLNIDRTNVSRLCDRMVALGEAERVPHPDDGRSRLVRLTSEGQRLAERVNQSSAQHFATIVAKLDVAPAEIIDALDALTRAMAPCSHDDETST